jgi:hypothetical protein
MARPATKGGPTAEDLAHPPGDEPEACQGGQDDRQAQGQLQQCPRPVRRHELAHDQTERQQQGQRLAVPRGPPVTPRHLSRSKDGPDRQEPEEDRDGHQSVRVVPVGAAVGMEVDPEDPHGHGAHPEEEDGLRPEPVVLPPEADPVVAAQDLARNLAVVGLPWIP